MPIRSLPLKDIRVTDPFWSEWQRTALPASLIAQYRQLEQTGRLDKFRKAAAGEHMPLEGHCFNDSDTYTWLEASAYALLISPSPAISDMIDGAIRLIEGAQEDTGYLDTYMQIAHPDLKWRNLISMHEMYCAGHLIEAAVALDECLSDKRLLQVAVKLADHIAGTLGPGKRLGYCGHEEIELALIKLTRATGNRKYADLALWMIEVRGQRPSPFEAELDDAESMKLSPYARRMNSRDGEYTGEYCQDHLPIREHTEVVGHAVRAMYLYIAAAEVGDDSMLPALQSAWDNLTKRRMYVTGGIGPSGDNEGFTHDFDLPNLTAYAETCASIGLVFWADAMLRRTQDGQFAEVLERALYNGALAGISRSGEEFFYDNPLESRGNHERKPWFGCACCPPNIARLIGQVGRYAVGVTDEGFYIHIPCGFEASFTVKGVGVKVTVESNYPWSGSVKVRVDASKPINFPLFLRIPEWATDVETDLPGQENELEFEDGYAIFRKKWGSDTLSVDFGMEPRWVESDPRVRDNLGRLALTRGPLVYCSESVDLGFAPQLLVVDPEAEITVVEGKGMVRLTTSAFAETESFPDDLYGEVGSVEAQEVQATFIPYYSWANRGKSDMQVWIRHS